MNKNQIVKGFIILVGFFILISTAHALFLLNIKEHNPLQQKYMEYIVERNFLLQQDNFDRIEKHFNESYSIFYDNYFELPPKEYSNLIGESYTELELEQPCQWYSFLWVEYFRYNYIEYDLFWTDNHIFVIGYAENKYLIADQYMYKEVLLDY